MKKFVLILAAALVLFGVQLIASGQRVEKSSIRALGRDRNYYLFVPDSVSKEKPAPLIVMLHGSGRNGLSLVDKWKGLAKTEGIILVGPDSQNSADWRIPDDGPDVLYELVESLKGKYPIDPRRVYLFGHSAGAVAGLYLSVLESEYFAAAAIHAGSMQAKDGPVIERAKRKIPISIYVGTNDQFFPVSTVRATKDLLNSYGMNAQLTEIKNHTHSYYDRSDEINAMAWDFLKKQALTQEPRYERYKWDK